MSIYTRTDVIEMIKRGESLEGKNLSGINLNGVNLLGANFSRANLDRANLSGANLSVANLERANLAKADLSRANLKGANFKDANLNETNISGAQLSEANLCGASLTWANLNGARLNRANLSGARLSWATLSGAKFKWANLQSADFKEGTLNKASFIGAVLNRADFSGADLSMANFSGAKVAWAKFRKADLHGADFTWADLSEADLEEANLKDTKLNKALLLRVNLCGAFLAGVDLTETVIGRTIINDNDLDGAKYLIEQLSGFIINRKVAEQLSIPKGQGQLTVHIIKKDIPLLQIIMLTAFIEAQYDVFYIFLFSDYENIDKLKELLGGSLFHKLQGSEDAITLIGIENGSIKIPTKGNLAILLTFVAAIYASTPDNIKTDFYMSLRKTIVETKAEKFEEEKEKIDYMKACADLKEECRKVGEAPVDFLPPEEDEKSLPPALLRDTPKNIAASIERHEKHISKRVPRRDYLLAIKKLREEGMLTNKLEDIELANLLEVLNGDFSIRYQSLRAQLGPIDMDLKIIENEIKEKF